MAKIPPIGLVLESINHMNTVGIFFILLIRNKFIIRALISL